MSGISSNQRLAILDTRRGTALYLYDTPLDLARAAILKYLADVRSEFVSAAIVHLRHEIDALEREWNEEYDDGADHDEPPPSALPDPQEDTR